MKFKKLFDRKNKDYVTIKVNTSNVPDGLLRKCKKCSSIVLAEDVKNNNYICPKCGGYFRVHAYRRIEMVVDKDSFEPMFEGLNTRNPLKMKGYEAKVQALRDKTGLDEAVTTGRATIGGNSVAIAVCDGRFLMASMGEVVGEKIAKTVEYATKENIPVIIFACSGGARMQEGMVSLMQMAKTSAAVGRHSAKGLLYITVLTDPTTGGVTASFAMQADIILAEPNALIGFAGGVATGSCFLKKGFSLGRAYETKSLSGAVLPVLLAALLVIGVATGAYAASTEGPGSKHAPLLLALVVALVIGALAQKSRMCFAGSIRDVILMKNFDLLSIIAALFAVMTIYNIATGNFHLSFSGQPIAHSQHLWNILGMYVVGFAAVLAGGCPLRQLILAGQGSSDSAVTFLGMLLGAAFAHNFNLVGSAAKAATATDAAVPGGPAMPGKIAVIVCIVLLFVIAATNLRRKKAAK